MRKTLQLLVVILALQFPLKVLGQCCASGNPFISDAEQPALQSKVLTASLTYRYSHSEQFYRNDSPVNDLPFSQTAEVNYSELQLAYGITNWVTVMADIGYFFNKTLHTAGQDPMCGYGIGDAALYLKFNLYSNARRRLNISPSVGMKFPVGVFDQEVDNVKLPISVQPSSGSYKYLANVFISKGLAKKITLAGFISYEYAQLIDSENFYYQYGQQWIGAVYFNYQLFKKLSLDLQVRNEYRAEAMRENNEMVESSGYNVLYITPQLTYAFKYNWYLSAFSDIPVYKYYNGIQMSFGYAISIRLTKKLDFLTIQARRQSNKTSNL
jgi:hypothetical protein